MSHLINAAVRFAVTAEGRIYDYAKKVEVDAVEAYETIDGWWNLHIVKRLILAGKTIESAFTPAANTGSQPPPAPLIPPASNPSVAPPATAAAPVTPAADPALEHVAAEIHKLDAAAPAGESVALMPAEAPSAAPPDLPDHLKK